METQNNLQSRLKEAWDNPKKRRYLILFLLFFICLLGGLGYLFTLGESQPTVAENKIPEPEATLDTNQKSKLDVYNSSIKTDAKNNSDKEADMLAFQNEVKKNKNSNDKKDIYSDFGNSSNQDNYLVKNDKSSNDTKSTEDNTTQTKTLRTRSQSTTNSDAIVYSSKQMGAVVHNWGNEIRSGSDVRIRTTDEFKANGYTIPKNTYMYAKASYSGQRMQMSISGVTVNKEVIPLDLEIYDIDGTKGIKVPDAIIQQIANDAVDKTSESVKTTVKMGTVGEITLGAGKKSKDNPNIIVGDGYKIYLKPKKI